MVTYQDLLKVGADEQKRADFVRHAVNDYRASNEYKAARSGEKYYSKHNETIESFQKLLYTISGRQIEDKFGANYKLKTTFFRRLIIQQVQYLLGNGCVLDEKNKAKLGKDFDYQLVTAAKRAMAGGQAFLFWNYDHVEVFGLADINNKPGFVPLYSEETAELMAGIRYWFRNVGDKTLFRATLYEPDGITEYSQLNEDRVSIIVPKKAYKTTVQRTEANGVLAEVGENYSVLPIIPLYANDTHESELVGVRECLDCYDLVKSGLANNIDEGSGFYWLVKNAGGMDDTDLARLVQRLHTVHAATIDSDDGGDISATTLDIPVEARDRMLEILRTDIYDDFMLLDVKSLSAAQKTTQEIQAAYQAQDNKCDDMEYLICDALQKLFALVGIDEEPTFVRRKVVNEAEQANMLLSFANFLSDECIIEHVPFLTPEEAQEEIAKRRAENMAGYGYGDDTEASEEDAEE